MLAARSSSSKSNRATEMMQPLLCLLKHPGEERQPDVEGLAVAVEEGPDRGETVAVEEDNRDRAASSEEPAAEADEVAGDTDQKEKQDALHRHSKREPSLDVTLRGDDD